MTRPLTPSPLRFLLAVLAAVLALPAAAQAPAIAAGPVVAEAAVTVGAPGAVEAPVRHRIRVARVGGQCVYRVRGVADQDAFTVAPGDQITVQARGGLRAYFVFDDDGGVEAIRGFREIPLAEGASASRRVTVRDAIGRDTEHDVRILCCVERDGNRCAVRRRAVAHSADIAGLAAAHGGPAASGPSAEAPAPPARPLLGPRMVVVE